MKKKKIIIKTILIVIALLLLQTSVFALSEDLITLKNGMKNVAAGDTTSNSIVGSIDIMFYIIRYVGTGVSVITVIWLGIRYMVSSIEDKAEIKKRAVPIVIGCVLIFGVSNLLTIVANLFK